MVFDLVKVSAVHTKLAAEFAFSNFGNSFSLVLALCISWYASSYISPFLPLVFEFRIFDFRLNLFRFLLFKVKSLFTLTQITPLGLIPYNFIAVQAGSILTDLSTGDNFFDMWTVLKLCSIAAVYLLFIVLKQVYFKYSTKSKEEM